MPSICVSPGPGTQSILITFLLNECWTLFSGQQTLSYVNGKDRGPLSKVRLLNNKAYVTIVHYNAYMCHSAVKAWRTVSTKEVFSFLTFISS